MVEGAKRRKTPNEIALDDLARRAHDHLPDRDGHAAAVLDFRVEAAKAGHPITITVLVALLVCLIPTTIGGLLSAIGIAGMGRMIRANVIAMSGARSRQPATSMCCCWTRPGRSRSATARRRIPPRYRRHDARSCRCSAARIAGDETPEGRSIVVLAKSVFGFRERKSPSSARRSCTFQRRLA